MLELEDGRARRYVIAMHTPIIITTFGDLLEHGYSLTGYCPTCKSGGRKLDLAAMPAKAEYVGRRFVCRDCSGLMDISVAPLSAYS